MKLPPGLLQFTSYLTDPGRTQVKFLGHFARRFPGCQDFGYLSQFRLERFQPGGEVNPGGSNISGSCRLVFDDHLPPASGRFLLPIEIFLLALLA
jgi:hypothetical protein